MGLRSEISPAMQSAHHDVSTKWFDQNQQRNSQPSQSADVKNFIQLCDDANNQRLDQKSFPEAERSMNKLLYEISEKNLHLFIFRFL